MNAEDLIIRLENSGQSDTEIIQQGEKALHPNGVLLSEGYKAVGRASLFLDSTHLGTRTWHLPKMAPSEEALRNAEWVREHLANRVVPNPSPRNAIIRTESSLPDSIERGYHADGHKTWGFVIYRTTYESDADWAECMRRLRWWAADNMEYYNGQDVLELMTWTIFDDREQFENMDIPTVRRHFRNWTETAVQSEQSTANMGGSPRYRYCVQIDAEALKSVVGARPPPRSDDDHPGWVKLIDKNWLPRSEDPVWAGQRPDPNEYEPIDGITDERIGWVKVPLICVMVEYYQMFRDPNMVMRAHQRPPAIM